MSAMIGSGIYMVYVIFISGSKIESIESDVFFFSAFHVIYLLYLFTCNYPQPTKPLDHMRFGGIGF